MKRSKTYLKCLALSAVFASSALTLSTPAAYATLKQLHKL